MRRNRALLLVASVLLATFFLRSKLTVPLDAGRRVIAPVEQSLSRGGATVAGVFWAFLRTSQLTARVRTVEAELAHTTAELASVQSLREENAALRAALDLPDRSVFPVLYADVVGPATDGISSAVRINRGAANGVKPRAPVITAKQIVVGRVRDVFTNTATIDFISGGQFRVAVRDLETQAQGIVRGIRGLDVVIEGIPRTETLHVGDRLVTTGIDGVFPPHLLVGTVRTVRAPENAIFQEGSIQLPFHPHRLTLVGVLTGPAP